jgi:hypothetical protein
MKPEKDVGKCKEEDDGGMMMFGEDIGDPTPAETIKAKKPRKAALIKVPKEILS